MANEKLISSVFMKDLKVGSTELTILDTSFYPDYTFTVTDKKTQAAASLDALQQLNTYVLKLTPSKTGTGAQNVYLDIVAPDGKFLAQANESYNVERKKSATIKLDATGVGLFEFSTDFFPSLTGYQGVLSFYHDEAKTMLIENVTLDVRALDISLLTVAPERNVGINANNPLYPPYLEMGENMAITIGGNGPSLISGSAKAKFVGTTDGVSFDKDDLVSSTAAEMALIVDKMTGNVVAGFRAYKTSDRANRTKTRLVEVTMGEVSTTLEAKPRSFVDGIGWLNTERESVKAYRRSDGINEHGKWPIITAMGQPSSTGIDGHRGPLIIDIGTIERRNVFINTFLPSNAIPNNPNYEKPFQGLMAELCWDPEALTTQESRIQFGKYQSSWVSNVVADNSHDLEIGWDERISDPISNGMYGIPSSLSDFVILGQPYNRADGFHINLNHPTDDKGFFLSLQQKTLTGANKIYGGEVAILVMRKSEMLDTYPEWVPYPRVIKADKLAMTDNVVSIPESSNIDLREPRYVIQVTDILEKGNYVTPPYIDYLITKTKSTITIGGAKAHSRCYAIWDLGPDTFTGDPSDGRLRGLVKSGSTQPWVVSGITNNKASESPDIVILPTIGDTVQALRNAQIKRSATESKFEVSLFDNKNTQYNGEAGVLSWNTEEIYNLDRRVQFGKYQYSKTINHEDSKAPILINLADVNEPLSSTVNGRLNTLKDPELLMFVNAEQTNAFDTVLWEDTIIRIGAFHDLDSYVGKTSVLFLRRSGWTEYHKETPYPRIIYTDVIDLKRSRTLRLVINNSFMANPLDDRYQLLAQVKPKASNTQPITFQYPKLTRMAEWWKIDMEAGTTSDDVDLQVAIIDYGPGVELRGQAAPPASIIEKTFSKLLPEGVNSNDPNYSFMPLFSQALHGRGSSAYHVEALTNYGINRSATSPNVVVWGQGRNMYINGGGSRNSGRGGISWARDGRIGEKLKAQIPTIKARHFSTAKISPNGINFVDLEDELQSTGNDVVSFNDDDLVIIPVAEQNGNRFKYAIDTAGKVITYRNSDGNATMPMTETNQVSTLILKKILKKPYFTADTPYPRVIHANKLKITPIFSLESHCVVDLSDSSYEGVDLNSGRYQMVRAMHSTNGEKGLNGYRDGPSSLGEVVRKMTVVILVGDHWRKGYGLGCYFHYMIVDFGPDFDKT